jgi:hypothetical protein
MPNFIHSQKLPPKSQQGGAVITIFLILLLIPSGWLGYKIGLFYWNRFNIQHSVQSVAADATLTGRSSDEVIFEEVSKNLRLNDMSISAKEFSVNRSVSPHLIQVHLHNELKLGGELTVVFDDTIKEPIEPTHPL